ncbi:MAG: TetR/AcrR family transcriptional regulator [Shimia sp.]
MTPGLSTRTRLIEAAATLFRQKGYHGTGIAEVLALAAAPKGSLYHHFPAGKPDLAHAAADYASDGMIRILDDAFRDAADGPEGLATLSHKLAKLFDLGAQRGGCPVASILVEGVEDPAMRAHAAEIMTRWEDALARHLAARGAPAPAPLAATYLLLLHGAWTMARMRRDSAPLRHLPDRLAGLST